MPHQKRADSPAGLTGPSFRQSLEQQKVELNVSLGA